MTRISKWPGRDAYSDERVTPERAEVLADEAMEAIERGDYAEARELYHDCTRIYRKLKKRSEEADTLVKLAQCSKGLDEHKDSRTHYEEAISIYRELKDTDGLSETLRALGMDAQERENYMYAAKLLQESSTICEREGFTERLAVCLYLLAAPEMNAGGAKVSHELQARAKHAAGLTRESLAIAEAIMRLAKAIAQTGDIYRAQGLFDDSIRHYRNSGYIAELTPILLKTGRRSCLDGRIDVFASAAEGLLSLYSAGRINHNCAAALREIGNHALRLGDSASAYALFKESMGRSVDNVAWRDRAASYLALGCVASREEHDDIARSLFEKSYAALKEGASGMEFLELTLKLCRRIHYAEDLNAAALYFARCAVHARSLGEITIYIQAMYYRGRIAIQQGDYGAANRHLEECLIYYSEAGPVRRLGRTLTEKGVALFAVGDETKGRSYMKKGLEIARSEKDEVGAAAALSALGTWIPDGSDGRFEEECLEQCSGLGSVHGEHYPHRAVTHLLGDLYRQRNAVNDACRLYLKCILIMGQEGRLMAATSAIEGLAISASLIGLYHECVRLLAKACALRQRTGSAPVERNGRAIDTATSAARRELGTPEFDSAWADGERFGTCETAREAWSVVESLGKVE